MPRLLALPKAAMLVSTAGVALAAALCLLPRPAVPRGGGLLDAGYRADIAGRPVEGVRDNLSGLTFSAPTGTLFSVTNRPPQVVELTTSGDLLRLIPLEGLRDPEGITHVAGEVFLISDEKDQSLHRVSIDPGTQRILAADTWRIGTGIGAWPNLGIEGLSWDARSGRLFLAQELLPMRVLVIEGFDPSGHPLPDAGVAAEWHPASLSSLETLDLSSLTLHEPTGHLLLLSHLSAAVAEYGTDGRLVGRMSLAGGQSGLPQGIAQAEGLAVGPDGAIHVVGEPNLFYRFRPAP